MEETARIEQAALHFRKAYECQMDGDLEGAIAHYTRSIECYPTAEAYTFLGWAHSFRGNYEEAIRLCRIAIRVDPDFGNPYNDIGAYLIELGREDEAIPWLRQAMEAKRYEPRQYPHINLARVWLRKARVGDAIAELNRALALDPDSVAARRELHKLLAQVN